jgi:beta-xylosidase
MIATAGLWAPTIRFHKGTFYLLCTNCIRRGSDFEKRNFYITCNDIFANNWSDPIYFDFDVIDPSIFFDDNDRAYIQGSFDLISRKAGSKKTQPSCTIEQFEVDITTGKALSSPQEIWPGWAKYDTEGPQYVFLLFYPHGFY